MIRLVHPFEVDAVWPHLHEGMERACRKARCSMTAVEIYRACRVGAWFLHVVEIDGIKAGIAVDILEKPEGRTLKVIALCGSEMKRWLPALYSYEWLKTMGIKRIAWEGRPGLMRIPGARVIRQVYEMELGNAG